MMSVIVHLTSFFRRNQAIYLTGKCWNFIDEQYLLTLLTHPNNSWAAAFEHFVGLALKRLTFNFDMSLEDNNI